MTFVRRDNRFSSIERLAESARTSALVCLCTKTQTLSPQGQFKKETNLIKIKTNLKKIKTNLIKKETNLIEKETNLIKKDFTVHYGTTKTNL